MVNDVLTINYHIKAHESLRHDSSEKIILVCYLPKSVNKLVNELSGVSASTIPLIDPQHNLFS